MDQSSVRMKQGSLGIAREGRVFILASLVLALLFSFIYLPVGILFGIKFLFAIYFFRDPTRYPPQNSKYLVSPADGKVLKVETIHDGKYLPVAYQKISIFMSAFNVHVNRIPCDGVIQKIDYHQGKFFVASLDKASVHNERNAVLLETKDGNQVVFVQIAGLIARRIVSYLKEGMSVCQGERYGMIRYGSRMEICIPVHWSVVVAEGQKVWAGESPLAEMTKCA